jgi:hypothetical protein
MREDMLAAVCTGTVIGLLIIAALVEWLPNWIGFQP